jgi:hypothetical protein
MMVVALESRIASPLKGEFHNLPEADIIWQLREIIVEHAAARVIGTVKLSMNTHSQTFTSRQHVQTSLRHEINGIPATRSNVARKGRQ